MSFPISFLFFAVLFSYGTVFAEVIENLALGKIARQSSTFTGGVYGAADLAVDGDRDGNYHDGSVAHTGGGLSWWEVDLEAIASISRVEIYNRNDCCLDNLNGAVISILAYNMTEVASVTIDDESPTRAEFDFDNVEGTYVKIYHPMNGILMLAEVEVYGHVVGPVKNLAIHRPTEQSSTKYNFGPELAVDGNVDGDLWAGLSTSHTAQQPTNWWRVNLEVVASVETVILFNRLDSDKHHLNNAVITVFDYRMREVAQKTLKEVVPDVVVVHFDNVEGTYVQVFNGNEQSIQLAEVEVYGRVLSAAPSPVPHAVNLARAKPTVQSHTMYNGYSELAVDGNIFGFFQKGSVTHTSPAGRPWLQVDLQELVSIERVVLFNRMDCCQEKLNNPVVSILLGTPASIVHQRFLVEDSPDIIVVDFENVIGTMVHIVNPEGIVLSLAEVRVYGTVISRDPDDMLNA